MSIQNILDRSILELKSSGIITPELDVRLILEDVLKKDQSYFFAHPEAPVPNSAYQRFRRLIRRRKKGEPVAYLLCWKEFYGLRFKVNKNVLIPRPETELLVDKTISHVKSNPKKQLINILDIGTGSGCIIVSLAKTLAYDNIRYFGSDVSELALKVAKENAKKLNIKGKIKFIKSNLLASRGIPKQIDILLANLPYGPRGVKNPRINYHNLSFEPEIALFASKNGLDLIERLIIQISKRHLKPKLILLEIFENHPEPIKKLADRYLPNYIFRLHQDLAGLNRIIELKK